jgi:hypothetical protein
MLEEEEEEDSMENIPKPLALKGRRVILEN